MLDEMQITHSTDCAKLRLEALHLEPRLELGDPAALHLDLARGRLQNRTRRRRDRVNVSGGKVLVQLSLERLLLAGPRLERRVLGPYGTSKGGELR